jgi:hypothetical protein
MATSVAPALKAATIAALQARPNLAGVQVASGLPQGTISKEMISVHKVRVRQNFPTMPAIHREEYLTVSIGIFVIQAGGADATVVEARAYALQAELEQAVRMGVGDITLGGTVRWGEMQTSELIPGYDGETRSGELAVTLFARARI